MRATSRPWALPAWWAVLFAGLACQPAPPGGPAEGSETTGPAPLPTKAKLALAELSPAVARPEDAPDADKLPERAVDSVQQAEAQLAQENYFRARQLFERALGFAPSSPRVLRGLGLAFAGLGDSGKAKANLRRSTVRAPDHARVQLLLGTYAAIERQSQQALIHFRTALLCSDAKDDSPDTAEAWLRLGAALEGEGYWTAALECHQKLGRLISTHGRAYVGRPRLAELVERPERYMIDEGRVLLRLRRFEEAAVALERAYRRDKTHPESGQLAVQALLAKGDFDLAESILMEMLDVPGQRRRATSLAVLLCRVRKDPDAPARLLAAYLNRGGKDAGFVIALAEVAAEMGRVDAAASMLAKHLPSVPGNGRVVLRLARLYIRAGNLTAGASQLARLMAMDVPQSAQVPGELGALVGKGIKEGFVESLAASADQAEAKLKPALLTVAGMVAEAVGDRPKAIKLFRQAVAADAKFWPAYEALERLHSAQADFDAVEDLQRQVGKVAGESYFGPYLIGKICLQRGQIEQAADKLEQANARNGRHVPTLLLLGRAYHQLGRSPEAKERMEAALRLAPDDVEVVRGLFEFLTAQRRTAEANGLIKSFLQSNPGSIPGRILLGRHYFLTDQVGPARKELKALLAEAPDNVEVAFFDLRFQLPRSIGTDPIPAEKAKAAFERLGRILQLDPQNIPASRLRAILLANQKQYLEAAKALAPLRQRRPYDVALTSEYLHTLIMGKAEQQAAEAIETIARGKVVGSRMRILLLDKLIELKRYDPAVKLAERWLGEPADKQELYSLRIKALQIYEAAGQYDKAHSLLDQLIAHGPEAIVSSLRGLKLRMYVLAKRYDDAIAYVNKWLRNEPANRVARSALIQALLEAKAYDKAHLVLDEWIGAGGDAGTLRSLKLSKLIVYGREEKFEGLLRFGRKWIAEDPEFTQANLVLVGLLSEHEKYDAALQVAEDWLARQEKLAASDPKNAETVFAPREVIVDVLLRAERKNEALARAREFAKAAPDKIVALRPLYAALSSLEKEKEALALLEKMHKLDPDDSGVNNDLGYSWADRGIHLEKAEFMIRKALAESPNLIAFKDSLAWVLYKQGRFSEAKTIFDEAVKADPARLHPVILDHAGDTCWRLGLTEEAIRLWRRAVEMAKEKKSKDRETKQVLTETARKITDGRRGKEPKLAPLGRAVP